jgi:hypothetical protein
MSELPPQTPQDPTIEYARNKKAIPPESLFWSLISAGLFLYVGFYLGMVGTSDSAFYNGSVAAFTWGARIVGIGILVLAGLNLLRVPGAAYVDLVVSGLASGGCLVIGAIWIMYNDTGDGILVLLFGLINGSAARASKTDSVVGSHPRNLATSLIAQRKNTEFGVCSATMPSSPPSLKNP